MLITEVDIKVEAGKGGNGKLSFFRSDNSGPDGGSGGDGGGIYVMGIDNVFALSRYQHENEFKAGDGFPGGEKKQNGHAGKDIILKLPIGSVITLKQSGQTINILDKVNKIKIARGGKGGRGNYEFRLRNDKDNYYEKGQAGTKLDLHIELKLLADYGLVGLPNAGKTSLLNELTAANAKVGSYPFTTIEPGIAKLENKVIADIPGLIEGASQGKGLGTKFLKHIEKIDLILHCVASDSEDIEDDYETVCQEIRSYKRHLLDKPKIILLTKSDMVSSEQLEEKKKILEKFNYPVLPISIHDWDSLEELKKVLLKKTSLRA
jgi:GTPase